MKKPPESHTTGALTRPPKRIQMIAEVENRLARLKGDQGVSLPAHPEQPAPQTITPPGHMDHAFEMPPAAPPPPPVQRHKRPPLRPSLAPAAPPPAGTIRARSKTAAPKVSRLPMLSMPAPPQAAPGAPGKDARGRSQPPVRVRRLRIGDMLLARNLITQEDLDKALEIQRRTGARLGSVLVAEGMITVTEMVTALAEQLGVEVITQEKVEIDPSAREILSLDVIKRHEVVPLYANEKVLRIAMADPTNLGIIDELRFLSGRWIQVVLAPEATVRALIATEFCGISLMSEIMGAESHPEAEIEQLEVEKEDDKGNVYELIQESTGRPVINFVNFLLTESVRRRASDIHVEPYETSVRIRFRIDGELQTIVSPPQRLYVPVVSRIKVMAGMDISKRRIPQDGHLAVRYSGQVLHYRVSTLPTVFGEKCVLRLLSKEADLADLERIGLPADEMRRLRRAISAPQGLVLVTGPTGSGKTTTVHAALNAIAKPTINVSTLEDPVEVTLPGINHIQISDTAGVSFADGLRSLLRQDPDVVFVGEMRDAEVSTIAIRASLTGHLVLSTLHTNSAVESFDRLDDMGVERYLVAATIQTVVGQRLLRRICSECAEPTGPEAFSEIVDCDLMLAKMQALGLSQQLSRGKGCDKCGGTGYRRRLGVYEVLPMDRQIREMLRKKAPAEELAIALAERGFRTMYDNGLRLCAEGLTTLAEVQRVLAQSD